ncbi:hypothetical protein BCR43DRAFT_263654 [Syncephalastrum racemosum]|uniref:Uncharacterized protein n=1 Tax=Syncephalastrum racemosum TaxID=13706 RepID=A0A1X2HGW4_SYNRA|nr:hypothetical protein BCR43DRAFT_263654 [Syncephalastrum racemosum]
MWARSYVVITNDLAQPWIGRPLAPFAALAIFVVAKETCLLESNNWQDATLQHLFEILQESPQAGLDRETQLLHAIASLCAAGTRQFEDIINTSERLGYASAIVDQAQKGKQKLLTVKRCPEEQKRWPQKKCWQAHRHVHKDISED